MLPVPMRWMERANKRDSTSSKHNRGSTGQPNISGKLGDFP